MQWFSVMLVTIYTMTFTYADTLKYLKCTPQTPEYQPSVCDCKDEEKCIIKLEITKNKLQTERNRLYSINNGRIGPTIIVKYNATVVVDVFNGMTAEEDEDGGISIHWHGMHQWNVAFMDGVGKITQEPIKAGKSFRYIFRAKPSGTHWYHSHVKKQRDEGIFGALIVKEANVEFPVVIDDPVKNMIAIQEHTRERTEQEDADSSDCEPDRSVIPNLDKYLDSWRINGVKLDLKLTNTKTDFKPIFDVKPGKEYRFRILGAMSGNVLRFSIDDHDLYVMAADGYLTIPYKTDILFIHVGERYDIKLITHNNADINGKVFPIRIESVTVKCKKFHEPSQVGYAYLKYVGDSSSPASKTENQLQIPYQNTSRCQLSKCLALNCPFKMYSEIVLNGSVVECKNIGQGLQLYHETPDSELPKADNAAEYFFNFDYPSLDIANDHAMVNGVQFNLPTTPFVNEDKEPPENECLYENINDDNYEDKNYLCTKCPHAVYIPKQNTALKFQPQTVRFVLSAFPAKEEGDSVTDIRTHPIHLHGHSFFVRKIAYPDYNPDGTISNVNKDIKSEKCGPMSWDPQQPHSNLGENIDDTTVRKDVIVVPAGGYVVIDFLADNPGWWFMHCHIDHHLERGMAIVVSELHECENRSPPPSQLYEVKESFEASIQLFYKYEKNDTCGIKLSEYGPQKVMTILADEAEPVFIDETKKQAQELDEIDMGNLRPKMFNPHAKENLDYEHVSPYYKRFIRRLRGHRDLERKFQCRERDDYTPE